MRLQNVQITKIEKIIFSLLDFWFALNFVLQFGRTYCLQHRGLVSDALAARAVQSGSLFDVTSSALKASFKEILSNILRPRDLKQFVKFWQQYADEKTRHQESTHIKPWIRHSKPCRHCGLCGHGVCGGSDVPSVFTIGITFYRSPSQC